MKTKYLRVKYRGMAESICKTSFGPNPNITGLRKKYHLEDACLVKSGYYVYVVPCEFYHRIKGGVYY